MDVRVHIVDFRNPEGTAGIARMVADTAKAAEDAGFGSVSVMDHFLQMEWGDELAPTDPMLEGYTTLGYLAALTERVRLGLLVTGVTYRPPPMLAKIVTTLDVLSGGRAELGIGASWYEREAKSLGVAFPPVAERFERLTETLQICKQMWSDDDGPFEGKHYRVSETVCSPQPISRPHPPILVGGSGERKTLRLVAEYADACNFFSSPPDEIARKLDVLRGHCDDVRRDFGEIRKTMLYNGDPFAGDFVEEMKPYADLGIEMVAVMPIGVDDQPAWCARLGGIVGSLADL